MKRFGMSTAIAGVAAVLLMAGCSSVVNPGGDTLCKDFRGADEKSQEESVSKMLKDEHGTDPAQLEITATRISVQTYCGTVATDGSKIKDAPHG